MPGLHELKLTATPHNWRLFMMRKADPNFAKFGKKIFARDHHTCQFCGFRANLMQEVVNLDGNYQNNHLSNLVTACPLCVQGCFLESVGKAGFGGGVLILFPDISQADLNALCHLLFQSIVSGNAQAADCKTVYRNLKMRAQPLESQFGEGFSKPSLYGQMLVESQAEGKLKRHQALMKSVRLLPSMARLLHAIEAWLMDAYQEMR